MNQKEALYLFKTFKNLDMKMVTNTAQHVKDGLKSFKLGAHAVKQFLDTNLDTREKQSFREPQIEPKNPLLLLSEEYGQF